MPASLPSSLSTSASAAGASATPALTPSLPSLSLENHEWREATKLLLRNVLEGVVRRLDPSASHDGCWDLMNSLMRHHPARTRHVFCRLLIEVKEEIMVRR